MGIGGKIKCENRRDFMRYYGERSMAGVLKLVLNLALIIGFIGALSILYSTGVNLKSQIDPWDKGIIMLLLCIGIICVFLIVIQLKRVINTLIEANPFVMDNVKNLRKISVECFIVAGCYLVNFLINLNFKEFKFIYVDSNGIHTDMEFIIFIFAGCFILILSKVFEQAVEYKEENDFTV